MINKAETYISNVTGHEITVSRNACVRMVDRGSGIEHLGRHEAGTETVCKGNMIELPLECLPEGDSEMKFSDKVNAAGDVLKGYVLAGDLTDAEVMAILALYSSWGGIETGAEVKADTLLTYGDTLYNVLQTHNKQTDRVPDTAVSLFAKAVPEGVVEE